MLPDEFEMKAELLFVPAFPGQNTFSKKPKGRVVSHTNVHKPNIPAAVWGAG